MSTTDTTVYQVLDGAAALMNDAAKTQYTYAAVLPYLNMALDTLQEMFELNNVPVTNETSAVIPIDAGVTEIHKVLQPSSPPEYPHDLVEIRRLWERNRDIDPFIPMNKQDFLPHYMEGQETNALIWWVWINQTIRFLPSDTDNDVKIDYVRALFAPIQQVVTDTDIGVINCRSYLKFKTGAFCARYAGENETRADELDEEAALAIDRSMGISTKGRQAKNTRRRPFRANYRSRGVR